MGVSLNQNLVFFSQFQFFLGVSLKQILVFSFHNFNFVLSVSLDQNLVFSFHNFNFVLGV